MSKAVYVLGLGPTPKMLHFCFWEYWIVQLAPCLQIMYSTFKWLGWVWSLHRLSLWAELKQSSQATVSIAAYFKMYMLLSYYCAHHTWLVRQRIRCCWVSAFKYFLLLWSMRLRNDSGLLYNHKTLSKSFRKFFLLSRSLNYSSSPGMAFPQTVYYSLWFVDWDTFAISSFQVY